jgi:hypothetical protein
MGVATLALIAIPFLFLAGYKFVFEKKNLKEGEVDVKGDSQTGLLKIVRTSLKVIVALWLFLVVFFFLAPFLTALKF